MNNNKLLLLRVLPLTVIGWQIWKGSPVRYSGHEHIGIWFETKHIADMPHVPGHGSWHLFLIQALFIAQSELTRHSGLQDSYGFPWYSGKHSQIAFWFSTRHLALGPHGDG